MKTSTDLADKLEEMEKNNKQTLEKARQEQDKDVSEDERKEIDLSNAREKKALTDRKEEEERAIIDRREKQEKGLRKATEEQEKTNRENGIKVIDFAVDKQQIEPMDHFDFFDLS